MDYINKELRTEAILNGLCMQWQTDWLSDKNQDELMEMYKRGIDFCIKHDYPSLEWAKDNLDKEVMNRHNIYIDDVVMNLGGRNGDFVLNGDCCGLIEFSETNVATVYVRHTSDVRIICSGKSIVHIVVFDNASVDIVQSDKSKVICINKGYGSKIETNGDVKLIDRSFVHRL